MGAAEGHEVAYEAPAGNLRYVVVGFTPYSASPRWTSGLIDARPRPGTGSPTGPRPARAAEERERRGGHDAALVAWPYRAILAFLIWTRVRPWQLTLLSLAAQRL